jgi:hypothetical protein
MLVVVLHRYHEALLVQRRLGVTLLAAAMVVDQVPRHAADECGHPLAVADLSLARRAKHRQENILCQIAGEIAIPRAREHHCADPRPEMIDQHGLRLPIAVGDPRDERRQIEIVRGAHV